MNETFGARLLRLRRKQNLTQEEVANHFNISPQAVSKWENDLSAPDIGILVALAELLNPTVDELLGKETSEVRINKEKDIKKMIFKVSVISKEGDKVKINIPLIIIKSIIDSGLEMPRINNKDVLSNIDFKEIFALIEQGVIGKLVEVESADGDTVEISVE